MDRQTLTCEACLSITRVEILGKPLTLPLSEAYCPRCGVQGRLKLDPGRDWMEAIAEKFDGMDHRLIDMLFMQWEANPTFPRFVDYVEAEVAAILAEPD